jgi:hypothetical protein
MTAYIVVLLFTVGGVQASVLPREQQRGYADMAECKKAIPSILQTWRRLDLPRPDSVECRKIEIKLPASAG